MDPAVYWKEVVKLRWWHAWTWLQNITSVPMNNALIGSVSIDMLLFPLPFMVVGFGGAGLQLHYFQFLAQGTIFCVKLCRIFRSVTYLEIFLRHFGYCHSLVPDTYIIRKSCHYLLSYYHRASF